MAIDSARRAHLWRELHAAGLSLQSPSLRKAVLDEVMYCLYSAPHEGKVANYGCILTRRPISQYDAGSTPTQHDLGSLETNRLAADGITSFVWRHVQDGDAKPAPSRLLTFREPKMVDELQAFGARDSATERVRLPRSEDYIIVQRRNGGVSILGPSRVLQLQQNQWHARPYQYDFPLDVVVSHLWHNPAFTDAARRASQLALHALSPTGIGGTLVLLHEFPAHAKDVFDFDKAIELPDSESDQLTLLKREGIRLLVSLMAQLDGCVLVRADGCVTHLSVWLMILPEDEIRTNPASPVKRAVGGSRQLSARRASKAVDGVLVTISADGPVRAYIDGVLYLSTNKSEQEGPANVRKMAEQIQANRQEERARLDGQQRAEADRPAG